MLKHIVEFAAFFDGARDEYDRMRWMMSRPLGTLEFISKCVFIGWYVEPIGMMMMVGDIMSEAFKMSMAGN